MITDELRQAILRTAEEEQERAKQLYGERFVSDLEALGCIYEEETEIKDAETLFNASLSTLKRLIMTKKDRCNSTTFVHSLVGTQDEAVSLACEVIQLIGVLIKYKKGVSNESI